MEENIESRQHFKRDIISVLIGLQITIFMGTYMTLPGYVIPYLNNNSGKFILFFLLTWQSLGLALYLYSPLKTERKILFAIQTIALVILFLAPFNLVYLLGPVMSHPTMAM